MRDLLFRCRFLAAGSAAVLFSFVLIPSIGAQQLGNRSEVEEPFKRLREQFGKLLSGDVRPEQDKDKVLLDLAGRFYIYRVTWATIQNEKWDVSGMGKVQGDFEKLMNDPATKDGKNREFMKLLAHQLINRLNEVLKLKFDSNKTAVINAALMLPVLARCKQKEIQDFLLQWTKADPQGKPLAHPFIRLCAIKGLGELSAPGSPQTDASGDAPTKRARELARIDAIVQFINLPYPPEGTGPEYDAAFAFMRREGVKALAQMQTPGFEVSKGTVKGPVAFHLLKIASGAPVKVGPPYTLAEKLEAAIGLCQLKPAPDAARVNPDLAAYVVAKVLVEFTNEYSTDFRYFSVQSKSKDEPSRVSLLPWRSYGYRLEAGLETLRGNLKDSPAVAKKVEDLQKGSKIFLTKIKGRGEIEVTDVLPDFVASLRPASGEVYQGTKDFAIPLPAK